MYIYCTYDIMYVYVIHIYKASLSLSLSKDIGFCFVTTQVSSLQDLKVPSPMLLQVIQDSSHDCLDLGLEPGEAAILEPL